MKNRKIMSKIILLILSFSILLPFESVIVLGANIESIDSSSFLTNENINGFSLKKTLQFRGHPIYEYQHEKSGAWLIVEKNNDINKKFSINVKTPPENDKGINHIIEHCILNGSEDYPCKNMIWELLQISYATFLNAMTAPCYTTFPVSSTDEDELESLAKIYSSGVFRPLFLKDEKIFKKEGIRFELDATGNLVANGTVFNEMQQGSAVSISNSLIKKIFPDTQNKNFSGGIPEQMLDLTYKEVCDTYKKYYHPSNMVINLCGDINYERFMKWLDTDYLQKYDKRMNNIDFSSQQPEKIANYEVIKYYQESVDKNIFNAEAIYIIDSEKYKDLANKLSVISKVINDTSSERIKYLKQKGYLDISLDIIDTFYDPLLCISFSSDNPDLVSKDNTEKSLSEMFKKYPIEKSELKKVSNRNSFINKLKNTTSLYDKSINYDEFMKSFIRFGDPCSDRYFNISDNGKINVTYNLSEKNINKIINDFILSQNPAILVFEPSQDVSLNMASRLKEKISRMEKQKSALTRNYKEQKEWAHSENSPENLDTIKNMFKKLSDIKTPNFKCDVESSNINDKTYHYVEQEIGDFISYQFAFKINHLSQEDKKYLPMFAHAFNSYDTNNYSRNEFEKKKFDKLNIDLSLEFDANNKNAFYLLNFICDKNKIDDSLELVREQINNIKFDDKKNLSEFLTEENANYDSQSKVSLKVQELLDISNSYKLSYINSGKSLAEIRKFHDDIYKQINDEQFIKNLSGILQSIKDKVFNYDALKGVGICASKNHKEISFDNAKKFIGYLNNDKQNVDVEIELPIPARKSIAFVDPNQSNNKIVCIMDSKPLSDDSSFEVTCKIINTMFLIPNIREKLGAYGASINPLATENKIVISSYSDPNIASTIKIFKSIPNFIENSNIKSNEIETIAKSLLSSTFEKDKLSLSINQLKNIICFNNNYCDNLNNSINSIKNISLDKFKNHGKAIEKLIENARFYVITNSISKNDKNLFDEIIK